MYEEIISIVKNFKEELIEKSGHTEDIGVKKQWLTEMDLKIERKLSEYISTLKGEHKIYAEEEHSKYLEAENVWVIDPISYTFGYIHNLGNYAVAISHLKNKEIVFSLVYNPTRDELFLARKGKGAFLNGNKLQVTKNTEGLAIIFDTYTGRFEEVESKIDKLKKLSRLGRVIGKGSVALGFAYVAAGRIDAMVNMDKDSFPAYAGKLLVEEAGGKFTNMDGGEFNNDINTVGTNGLVHSQILEAIRL